jgi:hypothetical protein
MVVASIALLLAMGGTGYAAIVLPAGSVGTAQLQKKAVTGKKIASSAVTGAKVKDFSLRGTDFKAGELPAGAQGAKGDKGDKGDQGDVGAPGPLVDALPSGKTLRGYYTIFGSDAKLGSASISFPFPLAAAPTAHYIQNAGAVPAGCSGTAANPGANAGHLCVFEFEANNVALRDVNGPSGNGSADRFGASVFALGAAAGQFSVKGRWAVTAP